MANRWAASRFGFEIRFQWRFQVSERIEVLMAQDCDLGLIGLAVMGENLALNIESRGYRMAVFNRTTSVVDQFIAGRAAGKKFVGCHSLEELVDALSRRAK